MKLTARQLDTLKELLNIGIGQSANVLNTLIISHINLVVPSVKLLHPNQLKSLLKNEIKTAGDVLYSSVCMFFNGEFSGNARLIFSSESALKLVMVSTGDDYKSEDFDEIRANTLSEIGNIVLNSVMGAISNIFKLNFKYSVPSYREGIINKIFNIDSLKPDAIIILATTRFTVETLKIKGDIVILFEVGSFDTFLSLIDKLNAES